MINIKDLKKDLDKLLEEYNGIELKFIDVDTIVVEPWTRLKCQFVKYML